VACWICTLGSAFSSILVSKDAIRYFQPLLNGLAMVWVSLSDKMITELSCLNPQLTEISTCLLSSREPSSSRKGPARDPPYAGSGPGLEGRGATGPRHRGPRWPRRPAGGHRPCPDP